MSANLFSALYNDSDDEVEEGEIVEDPKAALIAAGNAWREECKGINTLSWADLCWDEEDEARIDAEIAARIKLENDESWITAGQKTPKQTLTRTGCACGKCDFLPHSNPPKHFSAADEGYCCSKCRQTGGKHHGGHCQKNK